MKSAAAKKGQYLTIIPIQYFQLYVSYESSKSKVSSWYRIISYAYSNYELRSEEI